MFEEIREDPEQVFDMRTMAIDALVRDRAVIVRLTRSTGRDAWRFFAHAGLIFGFILGIAQVFLWAGTHQTWLMPAFGFFVGYSTDWVALMMIFRPVKRCRYLGVFTWQGLFHKKREQVAMDYADLIAAEIISPRNVMRALLDGPQSDRLFHMIDRQVKGSVDAQMGVLKPLVVLSMGGRRFQQMKQDAVDILLERFPDTVGRLEDKAANVVDIRSLVVEKVHEMTDEEYEVIKAHTVQGARIVEHAVVTQLCDLGRGTFAVMLDRYLHRDLGPRLGVARGEVCEGNVFLEKRRPGAARRISDLLPIDVHWHARPPRCSRQPRRKPDLAV
jgi:hypothetical protein